MILAPNIVIGTAAEISTIQINSCFQVLSERYLKCMLLQNSYQSSSVIVCNLSKAVLTLFFKFCIGSVIL